MPDLDIIGNNALIARTSYLNPVIMAKLGEFGVLYSSDDEFVSELKSLTEANRTINCIISKESSWNPYAIGDNGKAYGLAQFHKETFDMFSKKYGISLDYYNSKDQIILLILMFNDGYGYHWTAYANCL
jgi:hypothetical protein